MRPNNSSDASAGDKVVFRSPRDLILAIITEMSFSMASVVVLKRNLSRLNGKCIIGASNSILSSLIHSVLYLLRSFYPFTVFYLSPTSQAMSNTSTNFCRTSVTLRRKKKNHNNSPRPISPLVHIQLDFQLPTECLKSVKFWFVLLYFTGIIRLTISVSKPFK